MKKSFKKHPLFLLIAILITVSVILASTIFPFKERKIYTDLIRLHVLANTSSDEDISIKYKVRDAILAESENIFARCETSSQAKKTMEETGAKIEEVANRVIKENGKSYKSHALWGKEVYPEREYEGFTLPAGEYYSLRILLGEGEGENWWCVLFPPLCLGAAKVEEGLSDVGIDGDSVKTFTEDSPKYKLKFKLLEWLFG